MSDDYIPPAKSRQPGTVKSASPKSPTTESIKTDNGKSEVGMTKWIGTDVGSQLQKKDTGIHIQP